MIDFHWQVELWKKLHKKTNETKSEGLTNEVSGVLKYYIEQYFVYTHLFRLPFYRPQTKFGAR